MVEWDSAEQFWSRPELVDAYEDAGGALDYELDAVRDALGRAAATGPVSTVHVVGVGGGRELAGIRDASAGATIHAWDISPPMVEVCRAHVTRLGLHDVTVHCASVEQIPRNVDGPADAVIALGVVLGYGTTDQDRGAAIDALRALCRPGAGLAAVVQQRSGRPDWAAYFAATSLLERMRLRRLGPGNRPSRHGDATVLFHHFTRRELTASFERAGFGEVDVHSLRQWATQRGLRLPRSSPNPLIAVATSR